MAANNQRFPNAYAAYEKYVSETGDSTKNVIVSTASPYKFTKDVLCSIDEKYKEGDPLKLMAELEKISNVAVPEVIRDIETRPVLHKNVCERDKIKEFVKGRLL